MGDRECTLGFLIFAPMTLALTPHLAFRSRLLKGPPGKLMDIVASLC